MQIAKLYGAEVTDPSVGVFVTPTDLSIKGVSCGLNARAEERAS